jgi:ABC-type dipeptide/oligopeptide/nickel transport system ATPase component
VQGEVVFKNVSFRYPTRLEVPVLDGFSLTVPSGKSLAIVGGSGSGKSTVGALLTRLYDPTLSPGDNSSGGAILLDGVDLRQLDPSWLRSSVVGVVSQEPVLFACSIADNIRYGRRIDSTAAGSAVSLDEVIEAAKMANAHTFISSFPNGYDTLVGERGVQLSGGQKQRVAIARAILKNPKVLILDEATSALDSESEAAVVEALAKLSKGRTTIMIAHRLSTIRSADLVALLSGGKIVEIGTFDELYGNDSSQFRKLVERQMRG